MRLKRNYILIGKNSPETYGAKYNWDFEPYKKIFGNPIPNVWMSSSYINEEFINLTLFQNAKLVSSSMTSGYSTVMDSMLPLNTNPDYLLVSRDILPVINNKLL